MYERAVWMSLNLVGQQVQVQLKNGTIIEGILHSTSSKQSYSVMLKMARIIKKNDKKSDVSSSKPIPNITISASDFAQLIAKDVTLQTTNSMQNTFKTDTDISGGIEIEGRQLQKWVPDSNFTGDVGGLGDDSSGTFDQFAVNSEKFDYKTTWDENVYTTKLDQNATDYEEKARRAQQTANEIERGIGGVENKNIHILEERGQIIPADNILDEEDRYSSVARRSPKTSPSKIQNENEVNTSPQKECTPPTSPSMGSPLQKERMRIRQAVVNGVYNKNPLETPPSNRVTSPKMNSISPLNSPLVGHPASIEALGLDPAVPKVSQHVLDDLVQFSLDQEEEDIFQQKKNRGAQLEALKEWSGKIDEKVKPLTKGIKVEEKQNQEKKESPQKDDDKKKEKTFNPNAKAFNPNAKAFTPKFATPTIAEQPPMQQVVPMEYYGASMGYPEEYYMGRPPQPYYPVPGQMYYPVPGAMPPPGFYPVHPGMYPQQQFPTKQGAQPPLNPRFPQPGAVNPEDSGY